MCHGKRQSSNDDLDEAIRSALHVEPDVQRVARLRQYWVMASTRDRRRQRRRYAVPAAAVVMAIVTAVAYRANQPDDKPRLSTKTRAAATSRDDSRQDGSRSFDQDEVTTPPAVPGRQATSYERLVFVARTKLPTPTLIESEGLGRAIRRLTIDPANDAQQVAESLGLGRDDIERVLLKKLPTASDSDRAAMLRLLAWCGTQRAVPVLLRVGGDDSHRDAALETIEQIVGIDNLASVVPLTNDTRLRKSLLLRLLNADIDSALRGYLSLVRDDMSRDEALTAAQQAPQFPMASLLALLDDEDKHVRLSAALVLGYVNGPDVTSRLISRVHSRPSASPEAWLALLGCRGERAEEFLSYAAQEPRLLGYCNYARIRWARMIP